MSTKDGNPKDLVGSKKAPMSCVSAVVIAEVGVAMLEGACKYGKYNYRAVGVRASVYYDAAMRHLMSWWEGEDTDPDSGLSHITKAITSLVVLRDAMIHGKVTDDRPPSSEAFYADLNAKAEAIVEKYKGFDPTHYSRGVDLAAGESFTVSWSSGRVAGGSNREAVRISVDPEGAYAKAAAAIEALAARQREERKARDAAAGERWSDEKPTTPGWYLFCHKGTPTTTSAVVRVFHSRGVLVSSCGGFRRGHLETPTGSAAWLGPFETAAAAEFARSQN